MANTNKELSCSKKAVPPTLNFKPTRGGREFCVTSVALYWACNPVQMVQWDNVSDIEITNFYTKSMPPGILLRSLDENKNREPKLSTIRDNMLNLSNKTVIIDINTQESSTIVYSTV